MEDNDVEEHDDVDEDDDVRPHPDIAKTLTHVPAVSLGLRGGRGFVSETR